MIALFVTFFSAVVLLFLGLNKRESSYSLFAALALFVSAGLSWACSANLVSFHGLESWVPANMMQFGKEQHLFAALLAFIVGFILLMFRKNEVIGNDQLGLMMFSLCGAYMMVSYQHLVMLFLGIEVLSIPLFVLAGANKSNLASNEASLKYFLMGAFSTGIFLLGTAFIYGGTGSLELEMMGIKPSFMHAMQGMPLPVLINAGIVLMSVGLLFKVAAAPFHFWAPDVYEGSPNRTTLYMATVVKIAAFVAFYRFLSTFGGIADAWKGWMSVLGAITILWGNLAALNQTSVKRTLAFSSIAHAGYLVMFLLIADGTNTFILLFYGLAYAMASLLVFSIANQVSFQGERGFAAFDGLSKKSPVAAIALAVGVLSMAGIPVSAGFNAKFYLFSFAWQHMPWLVGVGLLGSAISVGYYFKFFKHAFMNQPSNDNPVVDRGWLMLLGGLILLLGALPWAVLNVIY
ncbi:MAG: NADH-quinone oxidoreductase subunit N [Bacteroidota bacterium]